MCCKADIGLHRYAIVSVILMQVYIEVDSWVWSPQQWPPPLQSMEPDNVKHCRSIDFPHKAQLFAQMSQMTIT